MHMYLGIGTCHELWLIVHIFLYMCLPLQTLDVLMHKQDFLSPSFSLSSFLCPHQITLLLCYAMPLSPPLSSLLSPIVLTSSLRRFPSPFTPPTSTPIQSKVSFTDVHACIALHHP